MAQWVKMVETASYAEFWLCEVRQGGGAGKEREQAQDGGGVEEHPSARDYYGAIRERAKRREKYGKERYWNLVRLIDCNWTKRSSFLTLTYSYQIEDVKVVAADYSKFCKRLSWHLYKKRRNVIQYVMVEEWTKKHRLHVHAVLFNVPYIKKAELERIWGHGFVNIHRVRVDSRENVGRYLAKYLAKEDERGEGRAYKEKGYRSSRGLKRPKVKRFMTVEPLDFEGAEVVYEKDYEQVYRDGYARDGKLFKPTTVHYMKVRKFNDGLQG